MRPDLDKTLVGKDIRPTAMRLLVLDYLLNQTAAVSLNNLETYFMRSDRITLYRTLKTFEEKGLVHRIDDGSGSVKYALCPEDCSTQEHMICTCIFIVTNALKPFVCLPPTFRKLRCRISLKSKK